MIGQVSLVVFGSPGPFGRVRSGIGPFKQARSARRTRRLALEQKPKQIEQKCCTLLDYVFQLAQPNQNRPEEVEIY